MNKYEVPNTLKLFTLEGELNVNELRSGSIYDTLQSRVLRRYPKLNKNILQLLAYEYNAIGFIGAGGQFRRRSQEEQVRFTTYCAQLGLRVLLPLSFENGYVENLFLEHAEKLDEFLTHASNEEATRCTHEIYMDMYKAHKAGIVYGDRWAENILVVPKIGVVNIDFDIEISGPFAKEFEAAQVACYILAGTKGKAVTQLANLLSHPAVDLNLKYIEIFLRGHAQHYDADKKYPSIENEIASVIALIQKKNKFSGSKKATQVN